MPDYDRANLDYTNKHARKQGDSKRTNALTVFHGEINLTFSRRRDESDYVACLCVVFVLVCIINNYHRIIITGRSDIPEQ